jgi:hypothetical protein
MISFPILNTSDYLVSTLSRSFQWNAFLQKHFIESEIPPAQKRTGRAMIWSPESSMYKPDALKDGTEVKRLWGRRLSFINIEQFERTMPVSPVANNSVEGGYWDGRIRNSSGSKEVPLGNPEQETVPADANIDEYEEGMVALDRIMPQEGSDTVANHEPTIPTPISAQGRANEVCHRLEDWNIILTNAIQVFVYRRFE